MLKKIFRRNDPSEERELSIEDLVTLERYDEAATQLQARIKQAPKDLHSHLKLAEVYVQLRSLPRALDEFTFVADSYAADGFFDKGIALLSKVAKLTPGDDLVPRRIERYRRLKMLEHRRRLAIEGLLANRTTASDTAGNSALEVELLWNKIAKSPLVEELSGEQLKKLFSVMVLKHVEVGQAIAKAGIVNRTLYLVISGVIEATAEVQGKKMNVRSFSSGDLVGDSVLLEQKPWPADYTVLQAGSVFELDREGFEQAMVGNEDPRGFIGVLRKQHNDRDVVVSVSRLQASG